ncbi:MAG: hypothetical protein IKQ17_05600 [Kiritimatiellae bacterium]|nr:hypothetical protein [Kiritimatiellia bacterium]
MKLFVRQVKALVKLSFLELWRRNDVFALVLLGLALMVPLSMASPFGAEGASRYLDEVALLLVWGFSLFVVLGAGQRLFPPEFESRTIYPLLAKPVSRGKGDLASARAAFESARDIALRGGLAALSEEELTAYEFSTNYIAEIDSAVRKLAD